jgi:olefin beta-lactone synthetase
VVIDAATTLFTEQVEPVFGQHRDVRRAALVGIGPPGAQAPVLCIELRAPQRAARRDRDRIERELRALAAAHPRAATIDTFLFHPRFPVDIRHNAKIGREALARWAARQLGRNPR